MQKLREKVYCFYSYKAYQESITNKITQLTKEGLGIRSTARYLKISTTTLLKRILLIASKIQLPVIAMHQRYEVDEIKSFIRKKKREIFIVYALNRTTKEVVSFNVGSRTKKTLKVVTDTLLLSDAKRIYTDGFPSYRYLMSGKVHCEWQYQTNHIERMNLNLRTHLKRLNRRTICFSKSVAMLAACLKIYFWG
ncbi:MAG: IS1 family transposase [Chitinophagaceae bacterium]|nr:IS1 family transposase [Chitinophagaceae bacterium]